MSTLAGRRKSAVGSASASGMAPVGASSGGGGSKRPHAGTTKPGGAVGRNRIDSSLMMSTNARKSSEDIRNVGVGNARNNKSSDRLHRMGGGASSTNLAQAKRSKSYSQLMTAGGASTTAAKKKKKEEREEDEDGWTSSSQRGTPDQNRSPKSESDDEDEGLVMVKKSNSTQPTVTKSDAVTGTTPRGQEGVRPKKETTRAPMERSDTQVTLRGFHTTPTQGDIPLPSPSSPSGGQDERHEQMIASTQHTERSTNLQSRTDDSLARRPSTPDRTKHSHTPTSPVQSRPSTDRALSSASSARTLTTHNGKGEFSSPTSTRSRASLRSRNSLYPRDSQGPIAPKLSTHYALAGTLGSLQEDSELEQAMGQRRRYLSDATLASSKSVPGHLVDFTNEGAYHIKAVAGNPSISSIHPNTINLPSASPSRADVSLNAARAEYNQQGSGSSALNATQRASTSGIQSVLDGKNPQDRRRTTSTHSLSAADAANLATRLRMARGESFDEAHTTTASKLLANNNSKYYFNANRSDMTSTKAMKEYVKPVVSTFVKRLGERKNVGIKVERGSVFDEDFSRAKIHGKRREKKGRNSDDNGGQSSEEEEELTNMRYVMDFGLGGPAIRKTPTTEALLGTLLDHDEYEATWAPALANAAGLGEGIKSAREAAKEANGGMDHMQNGLSSTGGVAVNGPNATPMHFLHGLTNTTDAPFPLDATDMIPTSQHPAAATNWINSGEYLDAKNLRSIAMTWTALNVNKGHIVTRRYVDPMRESLERVGKAGGMLSSRCVATSSGGMGPHHSQYSSNMTLNNGSSTPGGSSIRWGGWRNLFSEQHTLREET
ncbi:hypothetical protein CBS101457_004243 [Exobasidium rhododendri]|nr:hypothetical protein CBS101457_004243 [Exobasidium rhododendri]